MHPKHYKPFHTKYRKRALKYYGGKCNVCNYSVCENMLDVHHIDNDRSNNKIENLEVLCVWHHACKTRKIEIGKEGNPLERNCALQA